MTQIANSVQLILSLGKIHPSLGQWAHDLDQAGYDMDRIIQRLKALSYIARPDDARIDEFPVSLAIPARMVGDCLVTAFEGGSNHWCLAASPNESWVRTDAQPIWYDDADWIGSPEFGFSVTEMDDEGAAGTVWHINGDTVSRGLSLMAKNSPDRFRELMAEDGDAETADIFLQYVVLGEIVYG